MTIYFDLSNPHSSQKLHPTGILVLFGGPGLASRDLLGFFLFLVIGVFTRHSRAEQMSSPFSCAFRMSYPSVDLWLIVLLNRVIQLGIRTSSS